MNTDERPDLRRAAESKPLFRAETEKISGNGIVLRPSYPCPSVSIRVPPCPSVVPIRLRLRRAGPLRLFGSPFWAGVSSRRHARKRRDAKQEQPSAVQWELSEKIRGCEVSGSWFASTVRCTC